MDPSTPEQYLEVFKLMRQQGDIYGKALLIKEFGIEWCENHDVLHMIIKKLLKLFIDERIDILVTGQLIRFEKSPDCDDERMVFHKDLVRTAADVTLFESMTNVEWFYEGRTVKIHRRVVTSIIPLDKYGEEEIGKVYLFFLILFIFAVMIFSLTKRER